MAATWLIQPFGDALGIEEKVHTQANPKIKKMKCIGGGGGGKIKKMKCIGGGGGKTKKMNCIFEESRICLTKHLLA